MKAHYPLLFLALTAPLALLARAPGSAGGDGALPAGPTADQATTSKLVYGLLSDSRYAYRPRALDDAMSADVFEAYFKALDGSKLYFTAGRHRQVRARTRSKLDDAIKNGDMAACRTRSSTVYKQRVNERIGVCAQRCSRRASSTSTATTRCSSIAKRRRGRRYAQRSTRLWQQSRAATTGCA